MEKTSTTVDQYMASFPKETQALLQQMRENIRKLVPDAVEVISYGIPTFKLNGNLVHYAGYKNHIGFYPGTAAISKFQEAMAGYKNAKGTVQFPLDKPLPLNLIIGITKFCIEQNKQKAGKRKYEQL